MSHTFEMPVDAKKGCLELAKEMLRVVGDDPIPAREHLESLVTKVEASLDTEAITLEDGEISAMMALGECSDLLSISMKLTKALEPELSQKQVVKFSTELLLSATQGPEGRRVYKAIESLLSTMLKHPGGDCELTEDEHRAYQAIKRMYYAGGFNKK